MYGVTVRGQGGTVKEKDWQKFEKSQRFEMRVSSGFLKAIDQWRRHQPDPPSRASAIRRLAELGLKAKPARRKLTVD
jgi:hypothetical protein